MADYDTSWVPDGHTLKIRKNHNAYSAHLASKHSDDPMELMFHNLGTYSRGFWCRLLGLEPSFCCLTPGVDIPTDVHITDAFERLRKSYEKSMEFRDAEARILGSYPPNTVKV